MMLKTNIRQEAKAKSATRTATKTRRKHKKKNNTNKNSNNKQTNETNNNKRNRSAQNKIQITAIAKKSTTTTATTTTRTWPQRPTAAVIAVLCFPVHYLPSHHPSLYRFCAVLHMAHPPRRPRVELNNVKHKKCCILLAKACERCKLHKRSTARGRRDTERREEAGAGQTLQSVGKLLKNCQTIAAKGSRSRERQSGESSFAWWLRAAEICISLPAVQCSALPFTLFTPTLKSEREVLKKKTLRNAHQKQLKRKGNLIWQARSQSQLTFAALMAKAKENAVEMLENCIHTHCAL